MVAGGITEGFEETDVHLQSRSRLVQKTLLFLELRGRYMALHLINF